MEADKTNHIGGSPSPSAAGYPNCGSYMISKETDKILGWVMSCINEAKLEGARQCIHSGLFKAFYAGRECEKQNSDNDRAKPRGE